MTRAEMSKILTDNINGHLAAFREEYFNEISEKQGHEADDCGSAEAQGQTADRKS